jgi:DNA-directed RNA polymerase specialized sigma24 family protein
VRLETLTSRDGCSTSEAVERLVTSGEPGCTAIELRALAARLPHRDSLRPVEVSDDSPALEAHEVSQAEFVDPLAAMDRSLIEAKLSEAVGSLPANDRLLLEMRFWENMSVADISRIVGIPQKQLYRRIDQVAASVRHRLLKGGVTADDVRELIR